MAKGITRKTCLDGVEVKIISRAKTFDVIITIPKGTNFWQKRENNHCWIKFKTHQFHRASHKEIVLTAKNQPYDFSQLLKHFRKDFAIEEGGRCIISVFPTFYLPEEYAEKSRQEREWRDTYGTRNPGICTRVGGSAGRGKRGKSTVYSHNNASHPHQGGKCSPKWGKGSISRAGGPFCKNLLTSRKIYCKIQTRVSQKCKK